MSELELVWIRECEICGREHRRVENHSIRSIEDIDTETGEFRNKCEHWYRAHIAALQVYRFGVEEQQKAVRESV